MIVTSIYGTAVLVEKDTTDGRDVLLKTGNSPDVLLSPKRARRLAKALRKAAKAADRERASCRCGS